jgi:hypothetical protein
MMFNVGPLAAQEIVVAVAPPAPLHVTFASITCMPVLDAGTSVPGAKPV